MRPILKISNLTQLQDARSSAAVGFDIISFSLERGSNRKLSASMIWNMVNWLSGPEIALELNEASIPELDQVAEQMDYQVLTFPAAGFGLSLLGDRTAKKIILRTDAPAPDAEIEAALEALTGAGIQGIVEVSLENPQDAANWTPLADQVLLHFPALGHLSLFVDNSDWAPLGFAIGQEAEEEPGTLDYEAIDDFIDAFEERFPRD
ncbi:hypothetical protein [Pontibacter sp. G13]|uniref:hypothetical protein n=1 Tax=Pontibacter sp. G13 TaxID=3074898 RepID=UPI00288BB495|nr:hypothetical protein [Pontibacter sp. G13]WNJ21275.1 hypothetical protein RJD25_12470 [Pontibacter sp. G13]